MDRTAYPFLETKIHALKETDLHAIVQEAVVSGKQTVLGYHNMHSLHVMQHHAGMRQFYERADYVHVDGMPLIWIARALGLPVRRENRLTSLDWLPSLLQFCSENGLRVFFMGSAPGFADKAAAYFEQRVPGLQIAAHHGYFDTTRDSVENDTVLDRIQRFDPHLVLVGMGMPRQEIWVEENRERLNAAVVWCLGGFLDYYAGVVPTPPRWLGPLGLEWLFRLMSEPKRLWRRYLLEPWSVVRLLLRNRRTGRDKGGM
jgi:N-acetylglucosaminyldiphosphoundecaprenol N-acetyl-beta-D-mannosaminyltransferase